MRKSKLSPLVILFIVAMVLYGIIYVLPRVTGVLRSSYTAEYGELKTFDKTEGYLVRNEYVYFSEVTGEANRYISENKLVRKGTRIMEVVSSAASSEDEETEAEENGKDTENSTSDEQNDADNTEEEKETEVRSLDTSRTGNATYENIRNDVKGKNHIDTDDFITEHEGILSYHVDGNESIITPENMMKKDKAFLRKLNNGSDIELNNEIVAETDPVFKICDRAAWYIICYIPREHAGRYKEGTRLSVKINDEKTITGTVFSITDERREKKLIIKTNYYYSKFAVLRRADIEVITSDVMGLLISNTSIVKKGGKRGVYVRQKTGKYKFVPINEIATDGVQTAISPSQFRDAEGNTVSTVRSYDDILRRPERKAS